MNKRTKKIIKIVISCITSLILVFVAYLLICNIVAVRNEKPVRVFGYSYSYVPTGSMEPTIDAGDSIFFKKTSYDSLEVGDIIVYKSAYGETKGLYILHRVVEITQEGLICKGDANPSVDPEFITEDMFMGKYVKTFNFLNIGKLAYNKDAIYLILILFFCGIIVLETVNIYLSKQKKNSANTSNDELKKEVLDEMKEEILREIMNEKENDKKE